MRIKAGREAMKLSPAQTINGLVARGWITAAEGIAWSQQNVLPQAVANVVNAMPEPQRTAALILLGKWTVTERDSDVVLALQAATQRTDAEIDQFFLDFAT